MPAKMREIKENHVLNIMLSTMQVISFSIAKDNNPSLFCRHENEYKIACSTNVFKISIGNLLTSASKDLDTQFLLSNLPILSLLFFYPLYISMNASLRTACQSFEICLDEFKIIKKSYALYVKTLALYVAC